NSLSNSSDMPVQQPPSKKQKTSTSSKGSSSSGNPRTATMAIGNLLSRMANKRIRVEFKNGRVCSAVLLGNFSYELEVKL
ncbi:MAG: hypothetical protein MHPSP_003059, partial [Paramarteilia canceri]